MINPADLVPIVNRALQAIGTRTDVSADELTNKTSNEAIQAMIIVDDVRMDLLRMAPWSNTSATTNLTLISAAPGTPENTSVSGDTWDSTTPPPPWLYQYAYPADCVKVLALVPLAYQSFDIYDRIKFETRSAVVSGTRQRVIVTNQRNAILRYIVDEQSITNYDTLFISAWTDVLAAKLAMALTQDKNLANMLFKQANASVMEARAADANEELIVYDRMPDWMTARGAAFLPLGQTFDWGPLWPLV